MTSMFDEIAESLSHRQMVVNKEIMLSLAKVWASYT